MAISFPTSPSANDTYTVANKTWIYNGYAWDIVNTNLSAVFNTANNAYDKANAANVLAFGTGIGANNWANTLATSGNAYSTAVGASANNWANTKLANTNGVTFDGTLKISENLSLGNSITNVTQIIFNTGTNLTPTTPGALTWSQDDSTLHFDMDSPNNVVGHIGQDLFYYVKNQSGANIAKGTIVRFAGTLGASGRLLIAPAIANNSYPSKYVMGVTAANITNGSDGFVMAQGKIRGLDMSMFSAGDIRSEEHTSELQSH